MPDDRDALEELRSVSDVDVAHNILHYLYVPLEETATQVRTLLIAKGFSVEQRLGADGVNWLVLARTRMVPKEEAIGATRALLELIARENGGEYDGWEAEVPNSEG